MKHDKLATRLAHILMRFNEGGKISVEELASEFDVDTRTIYRDLHERLSFMPIKKEDGKYFLEPFALGKLSFKDIQNFAILSGIDTLYPKLDSNFIVDLLSEKVNRVLMVKNSGFEKVDYALFEKISVMILNKLMIHFAYDDKLRSVNPYKLINNNGIWYLLADEEGKLKHFALNKIKNLQCSETTFIPSDDFLEKIDKDTSLWLNATKEAILKLDKRGKNYFFRKKIFDSFEIIEEEEQSFILKIKFSYDDELLNIIKQWIPYIHILSPLELKEKLHKELTEYLKSNP